MLLLLIPVLASFVLNPSEPLTPAWSPNHEYLAITTVKRAFSTPEGGNYKLLLNGKLVYPPKRHYGWSSAYKDQHTFLSQLEWSPDSGDVAFVEKIYDWEYLDPYNGYWNGWPAGMRYYLTIVSPEGSVRGYRLTGAPTSISLRWIRPDRLVYAGRTFDLAGNPPGAIR